MESKVRLLVIKYASAEHRCSGEDNDDDGSLFEKNEDFYGELFTSVISLRRAPSQHLPEPTIPLRSYKFEQQQSVTVTGRGEGQPDYIYDIEWWCMHKEMTHIKSPSIPSQ